MSFRRITVFCGSQHGQKPQFREAAESVGRLLASREIGLVYGGGQVGLMGDVANAALAAGGSVTGVITEKLQALEVGHSGLTELIVVDSMHARKMIMASLCDGFIALPGGFGTMDEFFEVMTWNQLGYHRKPVGLLNVEGYYDPLLAFFRRGHEEDFITRDRFEALLVNDDPESLLEQMGEAHLPARLKWMDHP